MSRKTPRRRMLRNIITFIIVLLSILVVGAFFSPGLRSVLFPIYVRLSPVYRIPIEERVAKDWIVIGAKEEVARRVKYDASYQAISYPMGDVDYKVGACSDVVIRALRRAGYDLQELMHNDMKENFQVYPNLWGLNKPDPNIDHRRVANQMVFFERFGEVLPLSFSDDTKDTWQPGDIVCWKMPTGRLHTGVLSDQKNLKGVPSVIHNAFITIEDNALLRWQIIGHFRYPKKD